MRPLRPLLSLISLLAACSTGGVANQVARSADSVSSDATRLPTGVRLDPAGVVHAVGPMPLNIAVAPGGNRVALLLNGWSRVGVQVVDWRTGRVTQTVDLPAAFLGLAFSPDGQWLCASGGNTDQVYRFRWTGDSAVLADSIALAPRSATRRSGSRYPAQLAFSPNGQRLYVAENLADSLAVIDMTSGAVVQRLAAGRYPYGVVVAPDGRVYVSAWGGGNVAQYSPAGERLSPANWIPVGRHPSALLLNRSGSRLYVASASTDRIAVIDTKSGQRVAEFPTRRPAPPRAARRTRSPSRPMARLLVAEADNNAIAVFAVAPGGARASLLGRIPVEWYPAGGDGARVAHRRERQGHGDAANPDGPGPRIRASTGSGRNATLGQLSGTLLGDRRRVVSTHALSSNSRARGEGGGWDRAVRTRSIRRSSTSST